MDNAVKYIQNSYLAWKEAGGGKKKKKRWSFKPFISSLIEKINFNAFIATQVSFLDESVNIEFYGTK